MKKSILVISMLVTLIAAISCQREESNVEPIKTIAEKRSHVVSIDDALEELYAVLDAIGEPTRSRNTIEIENIHIVSRGSATRSSDTLALNGSADTTLYLVNFADSSGYAVLGADDRLAPVYAVVDSGSINPEAFAINDEVDSLEWAEYVSTYYVPEIDEFLIGGADDNFQNELIKEATDDEGYISDENGIGGAEAGYNENDSNNDNSSGEIITSYRTETQRKTAMLQTKWFQRSPFNDLAPLKNGEKCYAGCVALAVARVMDYLDFPELGIWNSLQSLYKYNSKDGYFDPGIDFQRFQAAELLLDVGMGCGTIYGISGLQSFAAPEWAKFFMNNCGFIAKKHIGYDANVEDELVECILNGKPVLIAAIRGVKSAHMWVLDGVLRTTTYLDKTQNGVILSSTEAEQNTLFHCCWGWENGYADGYYYSGIFDPGLGTNRVEASLGEEGSVGTNSKRYNWWFRSITYNLPNE